MHKTRRGRTAILAITNEFFLPLTRLLTAASYWFMLPIVKEFSSGFFLKFGMIKDLYDVQQSEVH